MATIGELKKLLDSCGSDARVILVAQRGATNVYLATDNVKTGDRGWATSVWAGIEEARGNAAALPEHLRLEDDVT